MKLAFMTLFIALLTGLIGCEGIIQSSEIAAVGESSWALGTDCTGANVAEIGSLCWEKDNTATGNKNLADAQAYCSNLVLDGYDDWRLPTIDELRMIIDDSCPTQTYGGACGVTDPNCLDSHCDDTCSPCTYGNYLVSPLAGIIERATISSSPYGANNWAVRYVNSYIYSRGSASPNAVRCVRDSDGSTCPDADGDGVCDEDDPCPLDNPDDPDGNDICGDQGSTGGCTGANVAEIGSLCWEKDNTATGNKNLADAQAYCSNLVLDGYDDWRLPTIDELRMIIDDSCPTQTYGGACGVTDPNCLDSHCDDTCSPCTYGNYLVSPLAGIIERATISSSPYGANNWAVRYVNSYIYSRGSASPNAVRCVRDSDGSACPDADGDGVCDVDGPSLEWPPDYPAEQIYAYTWSEDEDTTYADAGLEHLIHWDNLDSVWYHNIDEVEEISLHVARTNAMPVGHRVMFTNSVDRSMFRYDTWDPNLNADRYPFKDFCISSDNVPSEFPSLWWDKGLADARGMLHLFFEEYQRQGGALDAFVLDTEEYSFFEPWIFRKGGRNHGRYNCEAWCDAIQDDPRWTADDGYGYVIADMVAPYLAGKERLADKVCTWNNVDSEFEAFWKWRVVRERMNRYLNEAIYDVVKSYYPDVKASNWGFHYYSEEYPLPDSRYNPPPHFFAPGEHFGTHQSTYGLYGLVREPQLEDTPFNALILNSNIIRSARLSNPAVPFAAWLDWTTYKLWEDAPTDLFKENVFHTALAGADQFLSWNAYQWLRNCEEGEDPNTVKCQLPEDWADLNSDRVMDQALVELTDMIGYDTERESLITDLVDYTDRYLLTGMRVGQYHVWRFTPEPNGVNSAEGHIISTETDVRLNFEAAGTDAVLVIPDSEIWTSSYSSSSSLGLWVIQASTAPLPRVE